MDLSIHYLDKVEEKRAEYRQIAKNKGEEALLKALRSPKILFSFGVAARKTAVGRYKRRFNYGSNINEATPRGRRSLRPSDQKMEPENEEVYLR